MMKTYEYVNKNRSLVFSLVFLGAVTLSATNVWAGTTQVYRSLSAAKNGKAKLNPANFNFNTKFSAYDNSHKSESPCYYRFTISGENIQDPPQPNDKGLVDFSGNEPIPKGKYKAKFDNNPDGHWSISAPEEAKNPRDIISKYAKANLDEIINGKGGKQKCKWSDGSM